MSLSPVRSDLVPASFQRTITAAGAQVVLCDATNTPIAANPLGINHPPSRLLAIPPEGASSLVWLDLAGTSNTLAFPARAAGVAPTVPFEIPGTAKSIEAGTTTGFQIVACFHPEP